jgi:hypothetical protein
MRSKEGTLTNKSYRHVSVEGVSVKAPYEATLSWHPQKGTPSELVLDASGDNQSARAKSPGLAPGSGHVDLTVDIPEKGDVVLHSGVMSDRILIDFINIRSGTRSTYTVLLNESPEAYKKTNSL